MKAPKAIWIGIIFAIGGCTQLLELNQEYRPGQTGNAGMAGAGGSAGMGGAGAGGSLDCNVDGDCPSLVNACTKNACVDKVCVANNLPSGTSCSSEGAIFCNGSGICGQCNQPNDCTMLPLDDECQTRTCINHVCGQTFTTAGMLLITQIKGDCLESFCDGAGHTMTQPANMDFSEDNNPCTKNLCNAGVPSFPFEPINTSCGVNLKCNDIGQCVGCLATTDCAGSDDFCKVRTCTNGMCGFNFTAAGTDLPSGQTTNDCQIVECDSQGNIINSPENTDVPVDGNVCTKDVCTAGIPSNPFEPLNTSCGGGICNGAGVCKNPNGTPCMVAGECSSGNCIEGYCCDGTCAQTCKACNVPGLLGTCSIVLAGYSDNTCLSPKSCDGTNGGNSCTTKYPIGHSCTLGSECGNGMCVDGVCCSSGCTAVCTSCNVAGSAGTCTNLPIGQEDGALCSGTNSCNGMGVCKKDNGQVCASGTECLSGGCVDGVCCSTSCTGLCKACNVAGNLGTCSNVPMGTDDSPTCSGTNSCDGNGACKKDPGTACAVNSECLSAFCVDGVCCNNSCLTTCQACNVTGALGTCVNLPSGQEDPVATTTCMGANSCNGTGACLLDNGQPCSLNSQCVSNNCTGTPLTCQ